MHTKTMRVNIPYQAVQSSLPSFYLLQRQRQVVVAFLKSVNKRTDLHEFREPEYSYFDEILT